MTFTSHSPTHMKALFSASSSGDHSICTELSPTGFSVRRWIRLALEISRLRICNTRSRPAGDCCTSFTTTPSREVQRELRESRIGDLAGLLQEQLNAKGSTASAAQGFHDRANRLSQSGSPYAKYAAGYSEACLEELGWRQGETFTQGGSARAAECLVEELKASIVRGNASFFARQTTIRNFLKGSNFSQLASLAGNQPQLLFSGNARFRDKLAGGDSYSAKVSLEVRHDQQEHERPVFEAGAQRAG